MRLNQSIALLSITLAGILIPSTYAQTKAEVWTSTTDLSQKLSAGKTITFRKQAKKKLKTIVVNEAVEYQRIEGLGSSLEPTTCYNLSLLPEEERRAAIRSIVHPQDGIGMNLMRVCIGTPSYFANHSDRFISG